MAEEKEKKPTLRATPDQEGELIGVLKSDASRKEKADACRELSRFSTKASVETLVGLLGDDELAHMARYALETNPEPAVDDALREGLGNLEGLRLVGVIGSIGVRRDEKAVGALVGLLKSDDDTVVQTAARSLGNIATQEAVDGLDGVLTGSSGDNQLAICEGMLRCAEAFLEKGDNGTASKIYDRLAYIRGPQQIHTAAERGARLARV